MEKIVFNVEGMSCGHCVKAITEAVGALAGVDGVNAELESKTVEVGYDPEKITTDRIKLEIEEQGYDIVG